MTPQQRDHLARLTAKTMLKVGAMETARSYLRYEAIRKLNADEFQAVYEDSIARRIPFDELVDELVSENQKGK